MLSLLASHPRFTHRLRAVQYFSMGCVCLAASSAYAGAWVDTGNWQVRHHLEVLVDARIINIPISTWPVTWQSIEQGLASADKSQLSPDQRASYDQLVRALQQSKKGLQVTQRSHLSTQPTGLKGFDQTGRDAITNTLGLTATSEHFVANIQGTQTPAPADTQSARADGSYMAGILGNWTIGAGAFDRWWGPAWQNSLILGDSARPTPGVFIQRNQAEGFSSPLLSWLGPWQLTSFLNELEANRDVANAKYWGLRANLRPLKSVEIGFSRVAMFGGAGRSESLQTLGDIIVGHDNRGDAGISADGANEPGNQLAGMDLRWSWQLGQATGAYYMQVIGEDEAGGLPSRNIGMAGVEFHTSLWQIPSRILFEGSNTLCGFERAPHFYNAAYEHSIYTSGYRYRGRPLGASTDNDSEVYSLRGMHFLTNSRALTWTLLRGTLNGDATNAAPPGGNVYGSSKTHETHVSLGYEFLLLDKLNIALGADYMSTPVSLAGDRIGSGGHINISSHW